jgi:cell pole-organizing protein PopZ
MSDAKGNQEPSMEEILASIRRIISEDGEPKEEPAAPAVNGHATEEPEDDDALVLTDMVVGDSNVVELKEEPAPVAMPAPASPQAAAPVVPPAPPSEPEPEPEPETLPEPAITVPEDSAADIELDVAEPETAEPEPEPEPAADQDSQMDDGMPVEPIAVADIPSEGELVSPDVAAASAATMAQLVARKPQSGQSRATSIDGLLVETLVRQAIEPMLKDWLDEHLQEIVERLVRREVERLSRKAELS